MPARLPALAFAALILGATLPPRPLAAQAQSRPGSTSRAASGSQQPPADTPPVSMTCPMHPDVVESTPGSCPICKMNLVPVRLETIWTCPVHAVVHERESGTCPICRRALIQMTVAVTFTCEDHPEIDQLNRGTCPDGKPMVVKRTLRPHGNHNPQHGGQFFMAPDNTHHLEGAYPRPRVFRLYVYDDYARPLATDQVRRVKARVVTKETFDAATRTTKEITASPLVLVRNTGYFEAPVDATSFPAEMTAKVRFKDDGPEYRFDFTFAGISKDPVPAAPSAPATVRRDTGRPARPAAAPPPAPAPTESAAAPSAAAAPANPPAARSVPETTEQILKDMRAGSAQVKDLVQKGDFAAIWVPAFQTRDLAIALEGRLERLTAAQQETARPALREVVRTAWLLDAFGDLGNRQQITDAYDVFAAAVEQAAASFSSRP
jgi:BMFP domain-containing protein YqiC